MALTNNFSKTKIDFYKSLTKNKRRSCTVQIKKPLQLWGTINKKFSSKIKCRILALISLSNFRQTGLFVDKNLNEKKFIVSVTNWLNKIKYIHKRI